MSTSRLLQQCMLRSSFLVSVGFVLPAEKFKAAETYKYGGGVPVLWGFLMFVSA